MTEGVLDALESSLYPDLRSKLAFSLPATPLTLERMFNATGGAITGWSLEDRPPVPASLLAVFSAARTSLPHLWKAGQWSYSPSGVPVAILTGRIAAGKMIQALQRGKGISR
jgi:phytoene dehydrogenase-like protein